MKVKKYYEEIEYRREVQTASRITVLAVIASIMLLVLMFI